MYSLLDNIAHALALRYVLLDSDFRNSSLWFSFMKVLLPRYGSDECCTMSSSVVGATNAG